MRAPDTSPQRLQMTRDYIALRMGFEAKRIRGVDRMIVDLIAMVDALEAQVRDLTQPEDELLPGWAPCRRCARQTIQCGRNAPFCENCTVKNFQERYEADKKLRAEQLNSAATRAADPIQP